ncbi:MAG: hypothetical protein IPM17_07365 [Verrucomicrobia bacterium]|nr:hypothetical protein [Verrucomicrobiota bacterium]
MTNSFPSYRVARVAGLFALLLPLAAAPPALEEHFRSPPAEVRPWTYWFIMDGNLTREGITADFEAIRAAGLGGMVIMEVDVGIPRGPVKFMSDEWRALFAHAVHEAERLGLQITLNAGPGWTGSGGPWVTPEQSMQHLVASETNVVGPTRFSAVLPQPPPRRPFFGEGALPPDQERARKEFYRDEFVLAFPTPSGDERITDVDEKALYVRAPYSSQPGVKPFFPAPAEFREVPAGAVVRRDGVIDLTSRLTSDGWLSWDVPAGDWTIMRFGRTTTGANTRPAPAPGLGLESDKFDRAALEAHFGAFVTPLLRAVGRRGATNAGWTSLHIDSWEMGAQNWTAGFQHEFERRRGYDPRHFLPALSGRVVDSVEVTERFLWDLRQTAQELVIENHAQHLKELGRRHGLALSIEPYDMNPCANLSLGAVADTPMCEFWLIGFDTFFSVTEAASLANVLGRPVVAAEAFTSLSEERWQGHPAAMKALGDWAFSAGVNRIVFHRYQHQPWLDRRPGMTMGPYGVHWERTQTWWDLVPAYHEYLARCQWLLRRGQAVADVLFLAAEGAPLVFQPPPSATRGHPPDRLGYHFDACPPEVLLAQASVRDGRIVFPSGMSYRVLVLPWRDTITPALLGKVRELVAAGATVIGPPPRKSPSLSGFPECDAEVQRVAVALWGGTDAGVAVDRKFGAGRVVWDGRVPPVSAPATAPLGPARWIWHPEGQPASSAPVGRRHFRREFALASTADVESARLFITADNSFDVRLNGQRVGTGHSFRVLNTFDVAGKLRAGTNRLSIVAENGGDAPNPAGLLAVLAIRSRAGDERIFATDRAWQSATAANGPWVDAMELGPAGMAPWGEPEVETTPPDQYGDFALVTRTLAEMGIAPDFEADAPLRYTHRREGGADFYFVANPADADVAARCRFRVTGKQPELWDPLTGAVRDLPEFREHDAVTEVPLRFVPHQSFFVIFRRAAADRPSAGRNFTETGALGEIAGPWEVSFDPKWGGPERVIFACLEDWTHRPEEGLRYYSGAAVYRKTFDRPPGEVVGRRVLLDLGAVKNLARVRLNGEDLGVVWCAPWRVDATRALRERDNQLEVTVANLWPNRLIRDAGLPEHQRLTWTTWNPFGPDDPLLPSGLLGPVMLLSESD